MLVERGERSDEHAGAGFGEREDFDDGEGVFGSLIECGCQGLDHGQHVGIAGGDQHLGGVVRYEAELFAHLGDACLAGGAGADKLEFHHGLPERLDLCGSGLWASAASGALRRGWGGRSDLKYGVQRRGDFRRRRVFEAIDSHLELAAFNDRLDDVEDFEDLFDNL